MVEQCDTCDAEKVQFTTDDGEQRVVCVFCDNDSPFYTNDDESRRDIDY
ncbi:hypothetical protein M1M34_gp120 [Haloarcula tailed virus 2]|uniref:Uncharacterized protein n=1 Tax=Haloarcula tailed virus 2 TaxID=2877989 RepID=A0AAE9BYK3_9CAUD|nr:hypothetical protein M1M34_gp120 [Haloarcula tailed virus 2]UBF23213.1 hypothetical protein HATV-2_gp62 [Haloarcula tailed virus 2]